MSWRWRMKTVGTKDVFQIQKVKRMYSVILFTFYFIPTLLYLEIKILCVLVKDTLCDIFREIIFHQSDIIIAERLWCTGRWQISSKHQRRAVYRIDLLHYFHHIKIATAKTGSFYPHAICHQLQ